MSFMQSWQFRISVSLFALSSSALSWAVTAPSTGLTPRPQFQPGGVCTSVGGDPTEAASCDRYLVQSTCEKAGCYWSAY
jgi:hypothetical protein